MSGVVLTGHGGPECLEWRTDLPRPEPGPGEVLIRVGASAVNNTDINTRLAWYSRGKSDAADATWSGKPLIFPHIQGIDCAGTIAAVGPKVDSTLVGQRVLVEPCLTEAGGEPLERPWFLGSECNGAFAEYLTVAARHAHVIDSHLTDTELATFPCSCSTAENMIVRAGIAAGERVLVTGASGGVGSAAIQLLAARGADVVAVSQPDKADALLAIGAGKVISRNGDPVKTFGPGSFDAVIDLVGGPAFPRLLDSLRPGGRYAVAGAVAGADVALDLRTLYLKDLSFFGCTVLGQGVFAGLVRWIEGGHIKPLVAATYDLQDIHAAQDAFLKRGHIGKIAIRINRA
jgi:NADPH:quinone reductase-like Zn-dependent oxidoreductase